MAIRDVTLGARLIATTTALVLALVALFGGVQLWQQARIFDEQSLRLAESQLRAIEQRGTAQTRDLVEASRSAIMQSDYATLQALVPRLAPEGERDVAWAMVVDPDGRVVAHSDRARNAQSVEEQLAIEIIDQIEATIDEARDEVSAHPRDPGATRAWHGSRRGALYWTPPTSTRTSIGVSSAACPPYPPCTQGSAFAQQSSAPRCASVAPSSSSCAATA